MEKNELNIISSKTDFEGLNNDIVYQLDYNRIEPDAFFRSEKIETIKSDP